MIINKKTLSILTRSDKPNENWTKDDCYVIADGSKLANKIINNYPNIEYLIENDEIKDVNITEPISETEKPITIDDRVTALENALLELIIGGVE